MWVIVVNKNLQQKRENRISEILQEESIDNYNSYLYYIHGKYNTTLSIHYAKIYKTESGAERVIKQVKSDNNRYHFSNRFYWIKDFEFSIRKITKEEWHSIITAKLNKLDMDYNRKRIKLLKEKDNFI